MIDINQAVAKAKAVFTKNNPDFLNTHQLIREKYHDNSLYVFSPAHKTVLETGDALRGDVGYGPVVIDAETGDTYVFNSLYDPIKACTAVEEYKRDSSGKEFQAVGAHKELV